MRNPFILFALMAAYLFQCKSHPPGNKVTLENTYWKLIEISGLPVPTAADGRQVYMFLTMGNEPGQMEGFAGCNPLGGSYEVDGRNIKFRAITTRMYCNSQMELENMFIRMLTAAEFYDIDGNRLLLYADNDLLGTFQAVADL